MSAPNAIEIGKQFRLSFSVNERGANLRLPANLNGNFDVLHGPSTGQSTNTSIVNGKITRSKNYSYTYILRAKKEGTFELRSASIEIKGKIVESNTIKIKVVKAQSRPVQQQGGGNQSRGNNESVNLGKDNLFVRVALSKRNVYKGEQIIATVKLYANPRI